MSSTLGKTAALLLGAVLLAGAAPAQMFHNLYYDGDLPNELTSVHLSHDGGFIASANFPDGAALVKLQAGGDVQWTRHYEGPGPLQTVQYHLHNPYAVWIGNEWADPVTIPVVVATDMNGATQWARRIELGMNAEARAVDTDDHTYWVGGTGWPGGGRAVPWIARIHTSGNAFWVRSFPFAHPCQLNSLTASDDGGAVGVGQILVDDQGTPRQRMFAFKVDSAGDLEWAIHYEAHKVDPSFSQQWLADVTYAGTSLQVTGVITGLCDDPLSPNCVPRPRSILVGMIDQDTGTLQQLWTIYDQQGRPLWAYTIARSQDRTAIGGRVDTNADSEALLLSGVFEKQVSFLQGKLYGDGTGPFTSRVEDVSWTHGLPPDGFVLTTLQRHGVWRPAIVHADEKLSADPTGQGCCEYPISLLTAPVSAFRHPLSGGSVDHWISRVTIRDWLIEPTQKPCTSLLP